MGRPLPAAIHNIKTHFSRPLWISPCGGSRQRFFIIITTILLLRWCRERNCLRLLWTTIWARSLFALFALYALGLINYNCVINHFSSLVLPLLSQSRPDLCTAGSTWLSLSWTGFFDEGDTRQDFRLSRESLAVLLNLLQQDQRHGLGATIETFVFLFWLLSGASYMVVSRVFGMPRSTVHRFLYWGTSPVDGRYGGQWRLDPQTPWILTQMMYHWHQGLYCGIPSSQAVPPGIPAQPVTVHHL